MAYWNDDYDGSITGISTPAFDLGVFLESFVIVFPMDWTAGMIVAPSPNDLICDPIASPF